MQIILPAGSFLIENQAKLLWINPYFNCLIRSPLTRKACSARVDHRLIVKGIRIKLLNLCMWEPLQKAAHLIFSKAQACYRARLLIELGPYPMRNSKAAGKPPPKHAPGRRKESHHPDGAGEHKRA